MKAVLISICSSHNVFIERRLKTSELRTRPPKLKPPFKVYTYESGILGRKKVVNEWVCSDMETWRMCMGIPAHLSKRAFVSNDYIWIYSNKGKKDITEMRISNLIIYDEPKELGEFKMICTKNTDCYLCDRYDHIRKDCNNTITRPPQSWCYVEEV